LNLYQITSTFLNNEKATVFTIFEQNKIYYYSSKVYFKKKNTK